MSAPDRPVVEADDSARCSCCGRAKSAMAILFGVMSNITQRIRLCTDCLRSLRDTLLDEV